MARNSIDLRALEERTQAIGQELLARATRAHAHLSVLNRWAQQVLTWCLTDPALKASLLRFIDVLPSLTSPREIARHMREGFPRHLTLPIALRLGTQLSRPGLLTHGALAQVIKHLVEQVATQFIADHTPEGATRVIQALAARGVTCSLDLLGEQVLTNTEADRYIVQCTALLQDSVAASSACAASVTRMRDTPCANLSIKPSALTPRFDPISPAQSVAQATRRIIPLLQCAVQQGALINLDMEHAQRRDLTITLAKHLLVHPDVGTSLSLGIALQAYLRDTEDVLEELLRWLTAQQRSLTIRLVKGAYWDAEVATAQRHHWPVPVYLHKAETDLAFERLTRRLLSATPTIRTAIASHNVRSIAHAMAAAEALGLKKEELEFQFLYGMGEVIQTAVVSLGYPVRIYTPIGALLPGMAYLVRRILENSANESFLRQDVWQTPGSLSRPEPPHAPATGLKAVVGPPSAPADAPAPPDISPREWRSEPWRDFSIASHRDRLTAALLTVKARPAQHYPMWIGTRARHTTQPLITRNPATPQHILGQVSLAHRADVDDAVHAAHAAQPAWAALSVRERVTRLQAAAALMRQQRDHLTAWEILEVGKTWREADADVCEAIDYLEYYSHSMLTHEARNPLLQMPGEQNTFRSIPRGVACVLAPWNFPYAILTGMATAALVTGNAVILKPAEQASITAAQLAELFRAAGIPPAIIQYVPGVGEDIGAALVRHPGTHVILFTGSKAVGLSIVQACATVPPGQRFIKHVVAEMGGKNAIIVDDDADLDAAVSGTLHSAFGYGGQKCSAASRIIVHAAVYERLLERLCAATDRLVLGDPADPDTDLGPLIDPPAQQRLREAIAHAATVGRIAYQYPSSRVPATGYFVGPTIVTDVPSHDRLMREELFGPLLCVARVESFEDALRVANDTDYALTGGVYSRSVSHLEWAMRAFDVGNLYLNRPITGALVGRQPFGGHRLSGLGTKAGGPDYLLELVIPKTICADTTRYGIPLDAAEVSKNE